MTTSAHITPASGATVTGGTIAGPGTLTGPIDLNAAAAPATPRITPPSNDARGITINSTGAEPVPNENVEAPSEAMEQAGIHTLTYATEKNPAGHAEALPAGHVRMPSESITDGAKGPTCDNI